MAEEQLVPAPPPVQITTGSPPSTDTQPESTEKACLSFTLAEPEAVLAEFLKSARRRRLNMKEEYIIFLEEYKTFSTRRQYESNWDKWMAYVTIQQPIEITIDFCVSFFRYLHDRGLASSPITVVLDQADMLRLPYSME